MIRVNLAPTFTSTSIHMKQTRRITNFPDLGNARFSSANRTSQKTNHIVRTFDPNTRFSARRHKLGIHKGN
jgi:hypothetical protein